MTGDPVAGTRRVVELFDELASGYDDPTQRFYPFAADRLVLQLDSRPGEKILDVATGTGHVALSAAQAVGRGGRVIAIDLSSGMLARCEEKLRKFGVANVDIHEMDACRLDFRRDYFDHVACSHGLCYLADANAALAQWRRVLRPGGSLVFTSFSLRAFRPLLDRFAEGIARRGIDTGAEDRPLMLQGPGEPGECRRLLVAAGLVDVEVHSEQLGFHLREPRDWWDLVLKSPLRALVARLSPAGADSLRDEMLEAAGSLATAKGIWLDVETLFASGRRPRPS